MDNTLAKLYQSPKTILTSKDVALLWGETHPDKLKSKIAYYVKQGALLRLTRGVFAKDRNYNPKELAASIYTPSYISFETVLREAGMIFQHYDTIFVAGPWSKTMTVDRTAITFRKLKDHILYNPTGVIYKDGYSIATAERAFLDMLYLFPRYSFDNLNSLRWDAIFDIVAIYKNKRLVGQLNQNRKNDAE